MGATLSSIPKPSFNFGQSKDTSGEPTASKKKEASKPRNVTRRSRRVAKSGPGRVIIKATPKSKTPKPKKKPFTPKSRKVVESKSKPILRKKSPRLVKHKYLHDAKGKGAPKYSLSDEYSIHEAIFAIEKGTIYEAKVLKRKGSRYYVHYFGYNKGQDKWIKQDEMMKVDPESRRYFKEVRGKLPEFCDMQMI